MKATIFGIVIVICLTLGFSPQTNAQQGQRAAPLTNAAVVKLTRAGFKEKTIISIISARLPNFDLSPDRMIELKRSGVKEKIIVAMLARQEELDPFDDTWTDDTSLSNDIDDLRGLGTDKVANPNGNSTNIFGSSGGVKGSTRSRGQNGSVAQDTETVGSATVRILRPPTEAGGGPAKLEKTPSLTNDSIQELVEAGFSEGTIIRRIEQSPVNFDLSAAKLEEMRKRRVSDKVLTAMKAAMGGDSK
ncbi:MAG: hypothetical protein WAL47_17080 [Pyrinomonadaceae bacterium]